MIRPIETRFDDCLFRSRTEARWAVFFKTAGIRYEYEKEGYALPSGWYLPDFFLPDLDMWLEVKGTEPTAQEMAVLYELHAATGKDAVLAVGAPEPRDQLILVFNDDEDLAPGRYHFADDRRNTGEFWFISEADGCFSIGPHYGPDHGRHPGIFTETKAAYAAAKSARFERRA